MTPAQRAELGRRGRAYNAAHFDRETLLRRLTDFMLGQGIPPAGDC